MLYPIKKRLLQCYYDLRPSLAYLRRWQSLLCHKLLSHPLLQSITRTPRPQLANEEVLQSKKRLIIPQENDTLPPLALEYPRGKYLPEIELSVPGQYIYTLSKASYRCVSGFYQCCVFDQNEALIESLSPDIHNQLNHRCFRTSFQQAQHLRGITAILTTPGADANYYHWLLDLLPKFALLQEAGITLESIDFFVINHNNRPYQRECLFDILKLPQEKVVQSTPGQYLKIDTAIVPTQPQKNYAPITRWKIDYINNLIPPKAQNQGPNKIYLARGASSRRKIINEQEIIHQLNDEGFAAVFPEKRTVREQANLFHHAHTIISSHGAGLANTVFCKKGTTLLEILSPAYAKPHYRALSFKKKMNYYCSNSHLTQPEETAQPSGMLKDFYINPLAVKSLIEKIPHA